jgi:hypothetical protein
MLNRAGRLQRAAARPGAGTRQQQRQQAQRHHRQRVPGKQGFSGWG